MKLNRQEMINAYREAIRKDVPLEWVLSQQQELFSAAESVEKINKKRNLGRDLPFLLTFLIGLGFILVALGPMLGFVWADTAVGWNSRIIAPIPNDQVLAAETSGEEVVKMKVTASDKKIESGLKITSSLDGTTNGDENQGKIGLSNAVIIEDQLDYKNLANWFASTDEFFNNHTANKVQAAESEYSLEIPKLGVSNAKIKIGGTSLANNLIHYETTAVPGEYGSASIFGHSTLRQWYNPAENNPDRYSSIFSTIMTLEKGDRIYIKYNGTLFTYQVISKQNVKPTDTEKLIGQDKSGRYLKLITCTPEGTTAMRGIVTAVLVSE